MHYNHFILITVLISSISGNALSKITSQGFPKSIADITVSQSMDLHSDGYLTYKDAPTYHQINISAPERVTQHPSIQGTVSPNNSTYNAPVTQQKQNNNTESVSQQNPNVNTQPHTPERPQEPPQPVPRHQEPQLPQPPQTQQQPQNNSERGICFKRDTKGFNHHLPPQNKTGRIYWWVGDSRLKGMAIDTFIGDDANEGVIAKGGAGHTWFKGTAISMLEQCLRDGDVVILAMGANDIGCNAQSAQNGAQRYITTYSNLISQHPNVTFKILSVNPVYEPNAKKNNYCLTNPLIEIFNNTLQQSALNKYWIDTYTKLKPMVNANTASDGLHYTGGKKSNKIEKLVYDTVMSSI